jgi:hypothetical protein
MTNPGGRPKLKIDLDQVEKLAVIGCTLEEIGAVLKISKRTLIRRNKESKFREAMERGELSGRASLRRAQRKVALAGNATMLIWLGKNILGQRDNPVDSNSTDRLDEVLRALQTGPDESTDGHVTR